MRSDRGGKGSPGNLDKPFRAPSASRPGSAAGLMAQAERVTTNLPYPYFASIAIATSSRREPGSRSLHAHIGRDLFACGAVGPLEVDPVPRSPLTTTSGEGMLTDQAQECLELGARASSRTNNRSGR
jgi:hypothetical protein